MHSCDKCPQIYNQINWLWDKEDNYTEEERREIIQSCYCDKLDGNKIFWTNSNGCDDYEINHNQKRPQIPRKKKLSKRERDQKYHQNLEKRARHYKGCLYIYEKYDVNIGEYVQLSTPYIKEFSKCKYGKQFKKKSSKKVRRYKKGISGKGGYKRIYNNYDY